MKRGIGVMNGAVLSNAVRVIICCLVFAYFVFVPFKSRLKFSYAKTAVLAACLTFITVAVTVLFLTPFSPLGQFSTAGIVLWILLALLFFRTAIVGSYFEILFIVLVVLNLYVNIVTIAKLIVLEFRPEFSGECIRAAVTILVLLAYLPLLRSLTRLYQQVIEFNIQLSFWRSIWSIPALTYLIFYVKIIKDYWKAEGSTGTGDVVFAILWSFTTFALFWVTLQMLSQTYKGIVATEEAALVSSQLRMQEEQYGKLLENLEGNARLRHDWRHHLLTVNGFAESRDMDGLIAYLKEMMPSYAAKGETAVCENHVADVIIRHWAAIAQKRGIKMEIRVNIPGGISVSDMDLCIIFGNLVENAMEACDRQEDGEKTIDIRADYKGSQLIIGIWNTCSNPVSVRGGVYDSTKHEGAGIGLVSVKHVVEKYKGILKIDSPEGKFNVNILINGK